VAFPGPPELNPGGRTKIYLSLPELIPGGRTKIYLSLPG